MLLRLAAATAALLLLTAPGAANASVSFETIYACEFVGCDVDPADGPTGFVDYTVTADGHFYRWDLLTDDPHASVELGPPNQVDANLTIANGDGTFHYDATFDVPYVFELVVFRPGRVSYRVWAPRDFNTCGPNSPAGQVCGASHEVFGNSTGIYVTADAPFHLTFREVAVPEPGTWALMILGFGGVGAALRTRRRAVALAG